MVRITDNRIVFGSDYMDNATRKWNEGLHRLEALDIKMEEMAGLLFSNGLVGTMNVKAEDDGVTLRIGKFNMVVKGMIIEVAGANNPDGEDNLITLPREELASNDTFFIFIEVWKKTLPPNSVVHRYGGIDSGSERLTETFEQELQWRLRVEKNISQELYPKGLGAPEIIPQNSVGEEVDYTYIAMSDKRDLFIVGDGTPDAQAALATSNGHIFASPVGFVTRSGELDTTEVPHVTVDTEQMTPAEEAKPLTFTNCVIKDVTNLKVGYPIRFRYIVKYVDPKNPDNFVYVHRYTNTTKITQIDELDRRIWFEEITLDVSGNEELILTVDESDEEGGTVSGQGKPPTVETVPDIIVDTGMDIVMEDNVGDMTSLLEKLQDYDFRAGATDKMGNVVVVEYLRTDGTVYLKSEQLNPDSEMRYDSIKWTYYNYLGEVVSTKTFKLQYDVFGNVSSREVRL